MSSKLNKIAEENLEEIKKIASMENVLDLMYNDDVDDLHLDSYVLQMKIALAVMKKYAGTYKSEIRGLYDMASQPTAALYRAIKKGGMIENKDNWEELGEVDQFIFFCWLMSNYASIMERHKGSSGTNSKDYKRTIISIVTISKETEGFVEELLADETTVEKTRDVIAEFAKSRALYAKEGDTWDKFSPLDKHYFITTLFLTTCNEYKKNSHITVATVSVAAVGGAPNND